MTKDELDALEALEKAATEAPWVWFEDAMFPSDVVSAKERARASDIYEDEAIWQSPIIETDSGYYGPKENDRAAIAAFRNAAPDLIAGYRLLIGSLKVLEPFVAISDELHPSWLDHEYHWTEAVRYPPKVGDIRAAAGLFREIVALTRKGPQQ